MRAKPKRRVHYYVTGRSVSVHRGDRRREYTPAVRAAIKLAEVINMAVER